MKLFPVNSEESNALPSDLAGYPYEDSSGTLYVCLNLDVVSANLQASPFKHGLEGKVVLDIFELSENTFLVAAHDGVSIFNRSTGENITLSDYLNINFEEPGASTEVILDKKDRIWVGSWGYGLKFINLKSKELTAFIHDPEDPTSLPDDIIYEIFEDSNGKIWIGSHTGGLAYYNEETQGFSKPVTIEKTEFLLNTEIWKIIEDSNNWLWLAGRNGITHYNPENGETELYQNDPEDFNSLIDNHVIAMEISENGTIWAGSWYSGIDEINTVNKTYRHYNETHGLPNDNIMAILTNGNEEIWVGTDFGLVRIKGPDRNLRIYFEKDGLPSNEFIGTSSALKSSDGSLIFGTPNGLFWFYPDELNESAFKIPTVIQSVTGYEGELSISNAYMYDQINILWNENSFTIDYLSIDKRPNAETLYSYKMEGLNDEWIYAGFNRQAQYSKIPPGEYTFIVKGTDSSGAWASEENWAKMKIIVEPHPAQTWWAYVLYVMSISFLIILIIRYYLKKQKQKVIVAEKEALQEKTARLEMEKLDRLKDSFLANTSHELRTPLHGIVGIAESLLDGVGGSLTSQVEDNLGLIVSSGRRLTSLVNDILDFSKLKEKDIILNIIPVDLKSVVKLVITLSKPLLTNKNVVLINSIPDDIPNILADENRLEQILYNLIGNAIKFTLNGEIIISAITDGEMITIFVKDTGIGIPLDQQKEIFNEFIQLENEETKIHGGTGLGLSITKSLIELQGGSLSVKSKEGGGSIFSFSVVKTEEKLKNQPLSQLSRIYDYDETPHSENIQKRDLNDLKILIVDDEPINLKVLYNHLSMEKFQVLQANNGMEAIKYVENEQPDLILLDIMMPHMNGYETCQKIREEYPANQLPIIMLTAKNQVRDLVEGLEVGANDYLAKPFGKKELLARIKMHLELSKINIAYNAFVPQEFLNLLNKDGILDVKLGDQVKRKMTVMFCDIRDFTSLSEKMSPDDAFRFINEYLNSVVPEIRSVGGVVDKFMGDGIISLFPENVESALISSINMHLAVKEFNIKRTRDNKTIIKIGIGIHTGDLIVGTIGTKERMQETVISDAVNLASRMEGLTKLFGAPVLVSEDTQKMLSENFNFRFLGKVQVKGKKDSTGVFELLEASIGVAGELKIESKMDFEEGLKLYYQREFASAVGYFDKIVRLNPQDRVAVVYRDRCATFISKPPDEEWNGVEVVGVK